MHEPTLARRVLSGEAGWWATPVRAALAGAELIYGLGVRWRNARFDGGGIESVSVPVISVGNITVGGTGKTPFVIHIVSRLESIGCNPAVVARGYGSQDGQASDEELLVRSRCPGAAYVAGADRVAGAMRAIATMGADVIVLDDGFQHRRLHRDLDIVLIDATCPFGYGHVLPRGLLREPLPGLRRADLFVITRCDQVSVNEVKRVESLIAREQATAPILRSRTAALAIERLDGTPIPEVVGRKVVAFAAIGRPHAFLTTLKGLGADVVATRWWPDHHVYRVGEVARLLEKQTSTPHDLVLTTEKDAVKLRLHRERALDSIGVVKVGVEMLDGGAEALDRTLCETIRLSRPPHDS